MPRALLQDVMALPDGATLRGFPADAGTGAGVAGAASDQYDIVGSVRGSLPDGAAVHAVLKTLRNGTLEEEVAAEAPVDAAGSYRLVFERPAGTLETSDTSLTVR